MEISVPIKSDQSSFGNTSHTILKENTISTKLVGIEVDLFSYTVSETQFEQRLKDICGGNFRFEFLANGHNGIHSVSISPQEHCLVDGGMMYTSAVGILKELTESGLLISEYRTMVSD